MTTEIFWCSIFLKFDISFLYDIILADAGFISKRMELRNFNVYFFFLVLVLVSAIAFFLFQPFLTAVLTAAILAVIFQKPHRFFLKITGNRSGVSALLTSLLVIIVIVTPFFVILGLVANEVASLVKDISAGETVFPEQLNKGLQYFRNLPLVQNFELEKLFQQKETIDSLKNISQGALNIIQKTYQGAVHFIFWTFVMFFTLFYFLTDGGKLVRKITQLSPLRDVHEKLLIDKFVSITRATLKGSLVIGIIQATIGGITLAAAGVSSPVVWTVLMLIFSFVPMVGPAVVWFPAGVIMILLGNVWQGILILAVGLGIISTIDNLLRPKLVGRDTQMHPLLVFFATLGGLAVFGLPGFLIGPIIMALFLTLWEIYAIEFKGQLKDYNA
ncbi:MAG: AI-2E family transporter [Candidatus Moranbacteria bacterium]|nr:AI-2E family transporter [Candidatus Moranbacteria bacterium]